MITRKKSSKGLASFLLAVAFFSLAGCSTATETSTEAALTEAEMPATEITAEMDMPTDTETGYTNTFISAYLEPSYVLWEPVEKNENAKTAILMIHSDSNYLAFPTATALVERGFTVLSGDVRDPGSTMEDKMLDIKTGINYLRGMENIKQIYLLGHSGGGTLVSAYQAVAENGIDAYQDIIMPLSDDVADLPAADGLILMDSNWGNAAMTLFSLDPCVVQEDNGMIRDTALDPYDPANGYMSDGTTRYTESFKSAYELAQVERYNRLIATAEDRLSLIDEGKGNFMEDEPFIVPGADQGLMNNKLYPTDTSLLAHTKYEWPLLHSDGTETTQIVSSVRMAMSITSSSERYNDSLPTTVRNFLSNVAVRVSEDFSINEDGVEGIDWSSNITCVPGNVQKIQSPMLIMGMTGSWEYLAAEEIYLNAGECQDKVLIFVEGASHGIVPNTRAESYPGEFGDTEKTTYDYMANWLIERQ